MRDSYLTLKVSYLRKLLTEQQLQEAVQASVSLDTLGFVQVAKDRVAITKANAVKEPKLADHRKVLTEALAVYRVGASAGRASTKMESTLAAESSQIKATKCFVSFCDIFNLEISHKSARIYIDVAARITPKTRLVSVSDLANYYEKAVNYYKKYVDVCTATEQENTDLKLFKEVYLEIAARNKVVNMEFDIHNYADALQAVRLATSKAIPIRQWIEVNFKALAYFGSLPSTAQFHGEASLSRYYMNIAVKTSQQAAPTPTSPTSRLNSLI
jgi:hypothetical protein